MKRLIYERCALTTKSGIFFEVFLHLEGDSCSWARGNTFPEALTNYKKMYGEENFQVIECVEKWDSWRDYFTLEMVEKPLGY